MQSLVSIQSVPRSGSSWLGQIFRSSPQVAFRFQPLFSYAFKNQLGPESSREDCLRFFEELSRTKDDFILQRDRGIHVDYPVVEECADATHLVMKEVRYNHLLSNLMDQLPELKVVGLVRHPCAVIDSWIHAPREFKPEWSVEEQWRTGDLKNQGRPEECFGFDKWKEVARLFLQLASTHADRMKIISYADLNANPIAVAQDIFAFCGLGISHEVERFIQESRSKEGGDANSIYRKVRTDDVWKKRLPEVISNTILSELEGGPLARFL